MSLDYATLDALRLHHPAWRLLRSDHAALVVSFLHRVFVLPNVRVMAAADLAEALEDELYALRERAGRGAAPFPKAAMEYLNDWAGSEKGWLRKYYLGHSDEPQFDLTPATEKVIAWLSALNARAFVGTESRLLTLFELLKQMSEGSEPNAELRLAELHKRRAQIDAEIARVERGEVAILDDSALKDRFQQFTQIARELLTDFREVEQNFRTLDRRVRERIALWEGSKGDLLEEIMGERDAIGDSDQGRSFRAFWDFLMSSTRQEELTELLAKVLALAPVQAMKPDARTARVHYDWLEAGEHTQRTVAQLSQQLRRFLDDQAWLENRRIMDILRGIESKALALRDTPPAFAIMSIDDSSADIELPMERPLHTPAFKPLIAQIVLQTGELAGVDESDALFSQIVVDSARLKQSLAQSLQTRSQISLREHLSAHPLQHGLAELVSYVQLASEHFGASKERTVSGFKALVDEAIVDEVIWQTAAQEASSATKAVNSDAVAAIGAHKIAKLPRIIFLRTP
jgi:flagellar motility protein MotE (MotC chaperone)